jgi:hypothetical protein
MTNIRGATTKKPQMMKPGNVRVDAAWRPQLTLRQSLTGLSTSVNSMYFNFKLIFMWLKNYRPNWSSYNFKGIKSNCKSECGKVIRSGQKVKVHGRINKLEVCEVFFEPNHGFKIQGNNLADAYVIEVVKDTSLIDIFLGNIRFLFFSIT